MVGRHPCRGSGLLGQVAGWWLCLRGCLCRKDRLSVLSGGWASLQAGPLHLFVYCANTTSKCVLCAGPCWKLGAQR